ncbi:NERD domain-containing protein, partial [bacterium]|nr:NERD domain-containing protein [bacterium]
RNVYIRTPNGTTEIDLIVLSRKGLLVFECKNYNGNIYGDGRRKKWIQYLGRKSFISLTQSLKIVIMQSNSAIS